MSKELEALERIANARNHLKYDTLELVEKDFQIVLQALQRLDSIDNSKPSEALESLGLLGDFEWHNKLFKEQFPDLFNTIKQTLLEAKKFKEIVVTHNVHIGDIKHCNNVEEYNNIWDDNLTENEFNLLKRWTNENGSSNNIDN